MSQSRIGRHPLSPSRRHFLKLASGLTATALASPLWASAAPQLAQAQERSLAFYNLHTGEELTTTYWAEGQYLGDELSDINYLLRDHRTDTHTEMDANLLDLLHDLQQLTGSRQPFHVISGYRSPKTNAALARQSSGVAKKSYHMRGMAIDIRLPGVDLEQLHKHALAMRGGGVGYYRRSDFIHVDVGRVRSWRG